MKKDVSNFDSDPLTCDPALSLARNSPNSAKSNRIFSRKERGDKTLILTYLDSPMPEIFVSKYITFSIYVIFSENRRSKLQKCKLWVQNRILQKYLEQSLCLLKYYLWRKFRQNEPEIQFFGLIFWKF